MAQTFWDNNAGAGDNTWTTDSQWSTGADPLNGDDAVFTDVRSSANLNGANVQNATWPDNLLFTKYGGNVGSSGTHFALDDAAGSETLDSLKIDNCTGTFYLDFEQAAGSNTVTETRINVPGKAKDQINLGGAAAFTSVHLLRGRTNLGMTGTVSDLWVSHSTAPRDVYAEIAAGATITNIRQESGRIVNKSTSAGTFWMQNGGNSTFEGGNTITDVYVMGGSFLFNGSTTVSTITNLYVYGGTVSFTQTGHLRTSTNIYIHPRGSVDMRGVESLITTTTIETYGSGNFHGNKNVTRFL